MHTILILYFSVIVASMQTATIAAGNANGAGGSSLSALQSPTGISVGIDDSLYVSDHGNNRVIKFPEGSLTGSIVAGTGVAGNTTSQLNGPTGVYVDTSFNVYVADSNNYRVMFWRNNASVGVQVAGTGISGNTLSSFGILAGLFVDAQGNIYVCDSNNDRVMKFTPNVTNAVIVAGTGSAGSGSNQLNNPYGVYFDDVNSYLYVADYHNNRIQRYHVGVSTNGTSVAGGNGQGSASNQLNLPYSVCVSKITNDIYIADSGNNRVQLWNSGATSGVTIAGNGALFNNLSTPLQGSMDIKLSVNDTYLFVSETSANRVWRFQLV
jgi:sugar lactone lactonase YvrE